MNNVFLWNIGSATEYTKKLEVIIKHFLDYNSVLDLDLSKLIQKEPLSYYQTIVHEDVYIYPKDFYTALIFLGIDNRSVLRSQHNPDLIFCFKQTRYYWDHYRNALGTANHIKSGSLIIDDLEGDSQINKIKFNLMRLKYRSLLAEMVL